MCIHIMKKMFSNIGNREYVIFIGLEKSKISPKEKRTIKNGDLFRERDITDAVHEFISAGT